MTIHSHPTMRLFLCLTLGLLTSIALAQPASETEKSEHRRIFKIRIALPDAVAIENMVREFASDINQGSLLDVQEKLLGARYGFYGANVWVQEFSKDNPFEVNVNKVRVSDVADGRATAVVTYDLSIKKEEGRKAIVTQDLKPFLHRQWSEKLEVRQGHATAWDHFQNWQLVPPDTEPTLPKKPEDAPFLLFSYFMFKVAQRPTAETQLSAQRSLERLKKLGRATRAFAGLHYDQFAFAPEYFWDALSLYVPNKEDFFVPGTYERYAFNANLCGRNMPAGGMEGGVAFPPDDAGTIKGLGKVVMLYEGHDEKPTFRYDGKAALCFADGHVALVSPEEARSLIWNP